MSNQGRTLGNHILVTTDFSKGSVQALKAAKEYFLALRSNESRITLLYVLEEPSAVGVEFGFGMTMFDSLEAINDFETKALTSLEDLQFKHFNTFSVTRKVIRTKQSASDEIIAFATQENVSMIVMASHGRSGVKRLLLGSVAEKTVSRATCPVLIVPATEQNQDRSGEVKRIIVCTDCSIESEMSLPIAQQIYQAFGSKKAHLTLVYVAEDPTKATFHVTLGLDAKKIQSDIIQQARNYLESQREKYFHGSLVETTVVPTESSAHTGVVKYVEGHNVDTIILSRHGESSLDHLLMGSMTYKLIRTLHKEILVIPKVS